MDEQEWAEAYPQLLAETFRRRVQNGEWPAVSDLKRWAFRLEIDEDVSVAAEMLPAPAGSPRRWHAAEHMSLWLSILRHLPDASEVLEASAALTQLAVGRYGSDGDIRPIKADDSDVRSLSASPDQVRVAGSLLANEPYAPIHGANLSGQLWWFEVNERWVDRYAGVATVADFFDRQRDLIALSAVRDVATDMAVLQGDADAVSMSEYPRAVFVVHGRNIGLRNAMFDFLRSLGLAPLEWEQARALTGKTTPYTGEILEAAFRHAQAVIVLFTPDEIAYLQPAYAENEDESALKEAPQARPNVLYEAGMAMGWDADRTVLVEIGSMRPFSDIGGRHTVHLTNDPKIRKELAQRLRTAGCEVDLEGNDWLTTGDFTAPAATALPRGRRLESAVAPRPVISFDLRHQVAGGNRFDKLQVINRGTESAFDVRLSVPEDSALGLERTESIEEIPAGKSVTVSVWNQLRTMGSGDKKASFYVTVTGHLQNGEEVSERVFLDLNG